MSMIVQHNLTAMNANRMLGVTTSAQAKSSEKLSSGYKINRAADDAAGLSISEKMRKQIKGLNKASSNAQDGISAVQTAEGALTEVHSMLQRMNELATQASNGTNSDTDRKAIQDEIDQLTTEIDRVAETTKFNETYLLKGQGTSSDKYVNAHDAGLAGKLTDNGDGTATFKLDKALEDGQKVNIAGTEYTIGSKEANTDGYKKKTDLDTMKVSVGDSITTGGTTKTLVNKIANAVGIYNTDDTIEIDGKTYTIASATDLSNATPKLSAADAVLMVNDALAAGKTAKHTSTKADVGMFAAGAATNVDIVSSIGVDDVSTLTVNAATKGSVTAQELNGGTNIASGDIVTISGEKLTATTSDPANMSAIKDVVKQLKDGDSITIGGKTFDIKAQTNVGADQLTVNDALGLLNNNDEVSITAVTDNAKNALSTANLKSATTYTAVETKVAGSDENLLSETDAYAKMAEELTKASSIGTDTAATVKSNNSGEFTITKGTVNVKDALSFSLHVGADADMTNKITVDLDSMNAASLGVKGLKIQDDNGASATYAIDAIADAISKVSSQRSALGAVQNRLEHTIANLDNVAENTTSAESAIRDTDMATEMVNYSKNNILAQAGQSMLAQANQSTQGVLSILG
ncbi:MAG: flagellin [Agathobacter sp.]|nr:flagellin [Agathobacter sp.]